MKIYIRLKEYSYEGQDIVFTTTDRVRAFSMTEEDKSEEYFFNGDNQFLRVYEDERLVEKYEWSGDIEGFKSCW